MTFAEDVRFSQRTIVRQNDTFGEWSVRNLEKLFLPYRDPNYSLESIIHLFMHRLGQPYDVVMLMDTEKRDTIFKMELQLMEQERQANKPKGK